MTDTMTKGLLLAVALSSFVLASCVASDTGTPGKPETQTSGLEVTQSSGGESWEIQWTALLKAARREGPPTIYGTFSAPVRDALMQSFRQKYGMDVQITIGKGAEMSQKLFSENRANINIVDIYLGGPTTMVQVIKPEGLFAPLKPVLLLPEVIDPKAWWKGELDWIDKEHIVLAFQAYPSSAMALYTPAVRPEDIRSYRDLLNPKWKGKFVMNDPTLSGTGSAWIGIVGDKIMGIDFVRDFARQEPVITRDQRLQVEWLARNKYPIAVKPADEIVNEFISIGSPIMDHTPLEGTQLASGNGNVAIFRKSPHPNGARIFVNWLLSKEGQTVWSKAYGSQSGRNDVSTAGMSPSGIRVPGMNYYTSYNEEYMSRKEEFYKIAMEIYGPLMK